jgi:hypothetical protein
MSAVDEGPCDQQASVTKKTNIGSQGPGIAVLDRISRIPLS